MSEALVERVQELGLVGFTPAMVRLVYETMQQVEPDIICEWGTYVGNSARMLYEARTLLGLGCGIHSSDWDTGLEDRGKLVEGLGVHLHVGDGVEISLKLIEPFSRPLLLIDDNHNWQETYDNLFLLRRAAPSAVLLIHDTGKGVSGTGRGVEQYLRECGHYEVVEVEEELGMMRLCPS